MQKSQVDSCDLYHRIIEAFREMPLENSYADEETVFAPAVEHYLIKFLHGVGIKDASITTSTGGTNRPRVDLLGTNVWPDIEVRANESDVVAVELKLGRSGLASALSQTLGQSLLYRLKYDHVIGFIAHSAGDQATSHHFDNEFWNACERWDVTIILRHLGGD